MKRFVSILLSFTFLLAACKMATTNPTPTIPPSDTPFSPTKTVSIPTETATPTVTAIPTPLTAPTDTATIPEKLGGYPCPNSEFTCVDLEVPLDHFNPANSQTIKVVFGVLPASGESKGMFVTATGGPGTAGLLSADDYTAAFDPSIPEHFDIVFFDQRGVDQSGGLQCVRAAAKFYQADWDATTPAGRIALMETARTFANDCVAEMGHTDWLPSMGTTQAVEDLEAFRKAMGVESFWLYGESYGTQYAQTYAAAHPDHLAGLILDGTVDLTLSGTDYYNGQARAFNDVLLMTLNACNNDKNCAEAMGSKDAVGIYNRLRNALKQSPIAFDFPLPSGGVAHRIFTFTDLEISASGFLYSENERMIFLRALAAYARNQDLAPMARVLYSSLVLDPETLAALADPSYSDAVYYAVECQDYGYPGGTPEQRAEAYLLSGEGLATSLPNFSSIFYGDLPCAFWPQTNTNPARPAPLIADGIPTLVLGATADPATPLYNGQDVFSHLADGYMVTETGGPHIIFGWGLSCVDELVTAYLVNGQLPAQRETTCEGEVSHAFVPLAPINVADFVDPLEAMIAVDNEIYYLPEYYYWDVKTPTTIGCPYGGTLHFEASDVGDTLSLEKCVFVKGFVLTGSGGNDNDASLFTLKVTVSGTGAGSLSYTRDDNQGTYKLTGDYNGTPIELSR
jgi:pimeloyl-ACP methyl ester carboxylesterase